MSLNFMFKPRCIAVIGASSTPGKVGNAVMRNLKSRHGNATVYAINPKGSEIEGFPCVPSLLDIPVEVDVAVICIPAKFVLAAVDECGKKGVKGIILITAGFKEVSTEGAKIEAEMVARAKKNGIRILGPNCLGMISLYQN
nr:CoA-binding protein [Candidatus Sigynarchaeota archaeon]